MRKKGRFGEWFNIQLVKHPRRVVLWAIFLFNVFFLIVAALIISGLSLKGTEKMGFFEAAYYTITMILDAGCISFVVRDIGTSGVAIAIACMAIILIGMVSFTGAVIGYVTNVISNFIDNANAGTRKLKISDHLVILNWNTRASEIVNDLLYCNGKQKVVVLVEGRKAEIQKEINERLTDTITKENKKLIESCSNLGFFRRIIRYARNSMKNNVTVLIREGDVFSSKQLFDISLEHARSVIILGNDIMNTVCKFETREKLDDASKGNALTVKTLMQVSDITSATFSDDDQKIIVEVSDDWTWNLVNRIINYKMGGGDDETKRSKCNIVPVRVDKVLGQILSQFSLMPELNYAYSELFSNKGTTFYTKPIKPENEVEYISKYLENHPYSIPLTHMQTSRGDLFYYSAEEAEDIDVVKTVPRSDYRVKLNRNYWIAKKNVVILGHNSHCDYLMEGFASFVGEWQKPDSDEQILRIVVIDEERNLEKNNYYKDYPFVIKTVAASIYDKELICNTIEEFVEANEEDTSVLILSDDSALNDEIDANTLANLVYVQDIIAKKKKADANFDPESIDVIVEIIDPKHQYVVSSYSVDNVVISNRYISKMITQLGEKDDIYDFYNDILTYDDTDANGYFESKEVYAKKVSTFFEEIPAECTESELVRAIWFASIDPSLPENKRYPTIALGYVKPGGRVTLFGRDQTEKKVRLEKHDKIIVFTSH